MGTKVQLKIVQLDNFRTIFLADFLNVSKFSSASFFFIFEVLLNFSEAKTFGFYLVKIKRLSWSNNLSAYLQTLVIFIIIHLMCWKVERDT